MSKDKKDSERKLRKILNWILNILIIILLIVVGYLFIDRIFCNSPTDFQLISGTFSLLGLLILKLFTLIYSANRELGEIKVGVKNGFEKVKQEFNQIDENMKRIETKIDGLSRRVK